MSGHEEESVSIIDNRDLAKPNNSLLIICENASNDLKGTSTELTEKRFL